MSTTIQDSHINNREEHLKTIYNVLMLRLKRRVQMSILEKEHKEKVLKVMDTLSEYAFIELLSDVYEKLTFLNLEYLVCFFLSIETRSIAIIFNIDYQTVYSVHYRMRKKLGERFPY